MELIFDPANVPKIDLTTEETKLIEQARKALAKVNFYPAGHVVAGLVYTASRPIGLDFKVYIPGTTGQAFIAPTPRPDLASEMFEGERLSAAFHAQLKTWVAAYEAYWKECKVKEK